MTREKLPRAADAHELHLYRDSPIQSPVVKPFFIILRCARRIAACDANFLPPPLMTTIETFFRFRGCFVRKHDPSPDRDEFMIHSHWMRSADRLLIPNLQLPIYQSYRNRTSSVVMLIPSPPFWIKLDDRIDPHDGDASFNRTLQLFDLTHRWFENARFQHVHDLAVHQV